MRIESRGDALVLRKALAPIWAEYYAANGARDTVASTNMCCRTAVMIAEIDDRWRIVHGTMNGSAHTWCELDDGTALDLTADQFGGPEVVWGLLPEGYAESDRDEDCPGCCQTLARIVDSI